MRLDKLISHGAGLSRKLATMAIRRGRVAVNGQGVTQPDYACAEDAIVTLDGKHVLVGNRYYMLNKPAGVVCATRDPRDTTVVDLLPPELRRDLFPAGRLDKDTEGFVLLTNDGAFAHRILSPKKKVGKTYLVTLDGPFSVEAVQDVFSRPMDLGDGDLTSPARLTLLEEGPNPVARLVIYEGRYHQVKRMFGAFHLGVTALKRTTIGGLPLDESLVPGGWKPLTLQELEAIFAESNAL